MKADCGQLRQSSIQSDWNPKMLEESHAQWFPQGRNPSTTTGKSAHMLENVGAKKQADGALLQAGSFQS